MADQGPRAMAQALRYLSYRPRSRAELEGRLCRHYPPPVVAETLDRLETLKLLDDAAFARLWRDSRDASSPRSRSLVSRELLQKGVSRDVIGEATAGIEDEANAYRAAQKKARSLSMLDYETFGRRLAAHLLRRGFSFSLTRRTVERLRGEMKTTNPVEEEGP